MSAVEVLHVDTQLVTGRWRDVYVESIRGKFGPALVHQTNRLQAHAARMPGLSRMACVTVLHQGFSMQRAEMDVLNEETMRAVGACIKASAAVLLTRGFGAAVARSLYAGFNLFKPPPFPVDMVDTLEAGCAFIAPHVEDRPHWSDVLRAVEEIDRHGR